jgi:hypothetical protein
MRLSLEGKKIPTHMTRPGPLSRLLKLQIKNVIYKPFAVIDQKVIGVVSTETEI